MVTSFPLWQTVLHSPAFPPKFLAKFKTRLRRALMKNIWIRVALTAVIVMLGTGACAQLTSGAQTSTLNAQVNETLTVSPASGSYNFGAVTPGNATNGPGTTVAITTDYRLSNSRNNVRLCAYFGAAATAMTGAV